MALLSFADDAAFWSALQTRPREFLDETTSASLSQRISSADMDQVCQAFAAIVDAKSPFTADHSRRVAGYAVRIGEALGLDSMQKTRLWQAGLLHDLGKLGVPNLILVKPGKLTDDEWETIRRHPEWTARILADLPALADVRRVAAAHHEKLDGSGYWRGLGESQLSLEMRVLAVADIFDALTAERPYRRGMTQKEVEAILWREANVTLDGACIEAVLGMTALRQAA